jgi:hypothetical protein
MSRPRWPSEGKRDELEVLDPASVLVMRGFSSVATFEGVVSTRRGRSRSASAGDDQDD